MRISACAGIGRAALAGSDRFSAPASGAAGAERSPVPAIAARPRIIGRADERRSGRYSPSPAIWAKGIRRSRGIRSRREEAQAKLKRLGIDYCESQVREDLRRQIHGAALRSCQAAAGRRQGLHRSVRVSRYPDRLPGGLGEGARSGGDLRGRGQAPVRRARMGGRLRGKPGTAGLPLGSGQRAEPQRGNRAHARGAQPGADGPTKSWSYGPEYEKGICATSSQKTPGCNGGGWTGCGSNTFPAGDFPDCHSPLLVYDSTATRRST